MLHAVGLSPKYWEDWEVRLKKATLLILMIMGVLLLSEAFNIFVTKDVQLTVLNVGVFLFSGIAYITGIVFLNIISYQKKVSELYQQYVDQLEEKQNETK